MLLELENRGCDGEAALTSGHRRQPLTLTDRLWQILVVPILHLGFVVEQIDLRRSSHHVQVDGPFRFRRKMRQSRKSANGFCIGTRTGQQALVSEHGCQSSHSRTSRSLSKK